MFTLGPFPVVSFQKSTKPEFEPVGWVCHERGGYERARGVISDSGQATAIPLTRGLGPGPLGVLRQEQVAPIDLIAATYARRVTGTFCRI